MTSEPHAPPQAASGFKGVRLEPFTPAHATRTLKWVSEPEFIRLFMLREAPTADRNAEYFKKTLADSSQRIYALYNNDAHIGNAGFKNLLAQSDTAEIWLYIGEPSERGKGFGSAALGLILDEGFFNLKLKTITAHVAEFNTQALRLYESAGFERAPDSSPEWARRGAVYFRKDLSVGLMQPAFMPWLGYFELLSRSDAFVLLDDFQFSVQSYHQRNRALVSPGRADWYTVPVMKSVSFEAPLNQTRINESSPWRKKMLKRLSQNYSHAAHYADVMPWVEEWLGTPAQSLAELNAGFMRRAASEMGFGARLVLSSDLSGRIDAGLRRSERVAALLRLMGAKKYYCAQGAFSYMLEDGVFPLEDVGTVFQDFRARPYAQAGCTEFIPNLSAIDALMNIGPGEAGKLAKAGTERWLTWSDMLDRQADAH